MLVVLRVCPWLVDFMFFPKVFPPCLGRWEKRDRHASLQGGEADPGPRTACQLFSGVHPPHPMSTYTLLIFSFPKEHRKKAIWLIKIKCWGHLSFLSNFPQSWNKCSRLLRWFSLVMPDKCHVPFYIQKPWWLSVHLYPAWSTVESNTEGKETGRGPRWIRGLNRDIQSTDRCQGHLRRRSAICKEVMPIKPLPPPRPCIASYSTLPRR